MLVGIDPDLVIGLGSRHLKVLSVRRRLEALFGWTPTTELTVEDVKALVASLQDIATTLVAAEPADEAKVYVEMGIGITHHQNGRSSSNPWSTCASRICRWR
jgi:hypothetical protein